MKTRKGKFTLDSILFIKQSKNPEHFAKRILKMNGKEYKFKRMDYKNCNKILNTYCLSPKKFFTKRKATAILVKMGKSLSPKPRKQNSSSLNQRPFLDDKSKKRRILSPDPIPIFNNIELEVSNIIINSHSSFLLQNYHIFFLNLRGIVKTLT